MADNYLERRREDYEVRKAAWQKGKKRARTSTKVSPSDGGETMLHPFASPTDGIELPARFTKPFDYEPHPLCILAAKEVQQYLTQQTEWKEELDKGFEFSVTRPKDARMVFADGYVDLDGYIDSARHVASELLPDCIAKMGYDLFGETEEEYLSFMTRLHGPDAIHYRQLAESAGWREPYIDRRKVLR